MEIFPAPWRVFLADCVDFALLDTILARLDAERRTCTVYPEKGNVFRALELTPPEILRVVLIGQDPYHNEGEAQGLAFSVPEKIRTPPSLRNIFKEYADDLGENAPRSGDLTAWAKGGVLLLNSLLSVRKNAPGSHKKLQWEKITDGIVRAVAEKKKNVVFILWGNYAAAKKALIPTDRGHLVLTSAHPSPLSARRGFFGSKPFSRAEKFLSPWRWPRNFS